MSIVNENICYNITKSVGTTIANAVCSSKV